MKKIGVIINPRAKKLRRMKTSAEETFTEASHGCADIRITSDINDIGLYLKDFKKKGYKYIGVAGGDGTLHHVLTESIRIYGKKNIPPILILKGGTMDNVSKTIDIHGWGPSILNRFAEKIKNGETIKTHTRDTIKIKDRYCFLFGLGFVTNFLELAYKGEKGILKNIQVVLIGIYQAIIENEKSPGYLYQGFAADIIADGKKIPISYVRSLLCGTVEYIATGLKPLYAANHKNGTFHLLVSNLSPKEFILKLHKFLRGIKFKHKDTYDNLCSKLLIKAGRKFEYTMDGDIYFSDGELLVETGPQIKLVYV